MTIAVTTANIITARSPAIPTAVITESNENTISRKRIYMMTPAKEAVLATDVEGVHV